ncbi:hypothetical protein ACRAWD_04515 [Caulobacter segnis]
MAPLKTAWDEGALSVVLNTGTLFAPLTKALYTSRPDLRPVNLMSHEDQAERSGKACAPGPSTTTASWSRINDRAQAASLPPLISIAGSNLCLIGDRTRALDPAPPRAQSFVAATMPPPPTRRPRRAKPRSTSSPTLVLWRDHRFDRQRAIEQRLRPEPWPPTPSSAPRPRPWTSTSSIRAPARP